MAGRDALSELVGVEGYERGDEWARARVPVSDRVLQPYGIVHGGIYPVLAETICSRATADAVAELGMAAFGQSNDASFLRPISEGHVNAEGRVRHRGRTTWVWEVEMTDDEGRLCALVRVTIAVRPGPGPVTSPESGS